MSSIKGIFSAGNKQTKQMPDSQVLLNIRRDQQEGSGQTPQSGLGNITVNIQPPTPDSPKANKLNTTLKQNQVANPSTAKEESTLSNSELVYACVDYITKAASQAVPRLYRYDKAGNKVKIRNSKLNRWVETPNPFYSWSDIIELAVQGLLLSGNSFLTFEEVGTEIETWFLTAPHMVNVVPNDEVFIEGYVYGEANNAIAYGVDEIIHLKNPTLNNPYYGQPTIRPLFDTLVLEAMASDELNTFYKNSAILTGVLQSEYGLSSKQIETISNQFRSLYGRGGANRRGIATLPSGVTYKSIQATPRDAMILDTLNISEERVMRVFKLHPIVLGGSPGATTHTRELMKTVFNTAVRPYLYKIQEQITHFLRQHKQFKGVYFEFDLDRIVELDTAYVNKAEAVVTVSNSGLMTPNEARDILGLPKIDDSRFDSFLIPQHLYGSNVIIFDPQSNQMIQGVEDTTGSQVSNQVANNITDNSINDNQQQ